MMAPLAALFIAWVAWCSAVRAEPWLMLAGAGVVVAAAGVAFTRSP